MEAVDKPGSDRVDVRKGLARLLIDHPDGERWRLVLTCHDVWTQGIGTIVLGGSRRYDADHGGE
jgi:hypothetical protein